MSIHYIILFVDFRVEAMDPQLPLPPRVSCQWPKWKVLFSFPSAFEETNNLKLLLPVLVTNILFIVDVLTETKAIS